MTSMQPLLTLDFYLLLTFQPLLQTYEPLDTTVGNNVESTSKYVLVVGFQRGTACNNPLIRSVINKSIGPSSRSYDCKAWYKNDIILYSFNDDILFI